jgi:glutamine synthetase
VEAVFAPTDALTAADQMILFRNAMRQALRRAGWQASFVCVPPLPGSVASGWHLHQSLVDALGGNAMVRDAAAAAGDARDARQVLSDVGAHWLAGLLAHAPGLAAICATSIPAYARFRGSVMAPQAAVWGRDNRGAMLRVIGHPGDPGTRIENRIGEPMANPYLTMAAQIHAGLHGLRQRLQPPASAETPYAPGLPALPQSLADALDALTADSVLQQGLGAPMVALYRAIKRQELARHAQAEDKPTWERREYFGRY